MPPIIHRTVENPDDLKRLSFDAEQDHMLALGSDLASRKKVRAGAPLSWIGKDLFEFSPERIEVQLFWTPMLQCILANRSQIRNSRRSEFQRHFLVRASAMNSFLLVTRRVS